MASINKIQLPDGTTYDISTGYQLKVSVEGYNSTVVTGSIGLDELQAMANTLENQNLVEVLLNADDNSKFHEKVYLLPLIYSGYKVIDNNYYLIYKAAIVDNKNYTCHNH